MQFWSFILVLILFLLIVWFSIARRVPLTPHSSQQIPVLLFGTTTRLFLLEQEVYVNTHACKGIIFFQGMLLNLDLSHFLL